ncbi:MAG: hypothetical protein ACE5LU_07255 [Anaerolineae bacterium]
MSNPYRLKDLMKGARNVMEYGQVKAGEDVLILADTLTSPLILEALVAALDDRGANFAVLNVSPPGLHWREGEEPPRGVKTAVYGSDLVIEVLSMEAQAFPRMQETSMVEHGVRMVVLFGMTEDEMASPFAHFPYEVMHVLSRKVYDQWTAGAVLPDTQPKTLRITASNGTDLTATYDPRYVVHTGFLYDRLVPGFWNVFVGATVGIELFQEVKGVIVFDGLHGEEEYKGLPPIGSDVAFPLSEPVCWEFDGKYCTIHGGPEAETMRRITERAGTQAAYILCEVAVGMNPKASLAAHPTRHTGVTHYAIGSTAGRAPTPEKEYAPVHTHGHILRASIEIDGESVIEAGRLLALDDPEVINVASKYGDPRQILEEVAY